MGRPLTPLPERFWPKVDMSGDCWLWQARRDKDGYGDIRLGGKHGGHVRAHRVSWELHNGCIPDGLIVCHKCDNPPCVNPAHLFLGTHKDNSIDRTRKGRGRDSRGEKQGGAKLTANDVIDIRSLRAFGAEGRALARAFGVSEASIAFICQRKTWRHVP